MAKIAKSLFDLATKYNVDEYDPRYMQRKVHDEVYRPDVQSTNTLAPPNRLALQDLEGMPYLTTMSDRVAGGGILEGIGNQPIKHPIRLTGGQDFMREGKLNPEEIWASGAKVTPVMLKAAKELKAKYGVDPRMMNWRMTPTGGDFSHVTGQTMLSWAAANASKSVRKEINSDIKKYIPDFAGIEDPKSLLQFGKLPDKDRKKLMSEMDRDYRNKGGISLAQARLAVSDQTQINSPVMGLQNVGVMDIDRGVKADGGNPTYPSGLYGSYEGVLDSDVLVTDLNPEKIARGTNKAGEFTTGPEGADFLNTRQNPRRGLEMGPFGGLIDEALLKSLDDKGINIKSAMAPTATAGLLGLSALQSEDADAGTLSLLSRMARARDQGFDMTPEGRLYHASKQDIQEMKAGYDDGLVFTTPDTEFANQWLGKGKFQERQGGTGSIESVKKQKTQWNIEADKKLKSLPENKRTQYYEEVLLPQRQQFIKDERNADSAIYPLVTRTKKPFRPDQDYEVLEELYGKEYLDAPFGSGFDTFRDAMKDGNYLLYENKEVVDFLKSKGFDSMFLKENAGKDSPFSTMAVFDGGDLRSPNAQFKDPTSKNIMASAAGAGLLSAFQSEDADAGFFSQAVRAAENLSRKSGNAQGFFNDLTGKGQVKPDELNAMGFQEHFGNRSDISREEVQSFINDNQLQLKETLLSNAEGYRRGTKFGGYTLEGGDNYRELLMSLPRNEGYRIEAAKLDKLTSENKSNNFDRYTLEDTYGDYTPEAYEELMGVLDAKGDELAKAMAAQSNIVDNLRIEPDFVNEGHFDEPNILAHLRMKDRVDTEGNKTLLLEEAQSDWHQTGGDRGYVNNAEYADLVSEEQRLKKVVDDTNINGLVAWSAENAPELAEAITKARVELHAGRNLAFDDPLRDHTEMMEPLHENLRKAKIDMDDAFQADYLKRNGISAGDAYMQAQSDLQILRAELDPMRDAVPDAPFKTDDKSSWYNLAMKRGLLEAVEGGYDKMAITTGRQQADRYDLSKQINEVRLDGDEVIGFTVSAFDKNDNPVIMESIDSLDKLPNLIGKDAAKLLVDQPLTDTPFGSARVLAGQDLSVGGEGMKQFYDRTLPNTLNKLVKQDGVKVGQSGLLKGDNLDIHQVIDDTDERTEWLDVKNQVDYYGSQNPAVLAKYDAFVSKYKPKTINTDTVHSIDITPEMRERVKKGLPLFATAAAVPTVGGLLSPQAQAQNVMDMAATEANDAVRQQRLDRSKESPISELIDYSGMGLMQDILGNAAGIAVPSFEQPVRDFIRPEDNRGPTARAISEKVASNMAPFVENYLAPAMQNYVTPAAKAVYDYKPVFGGSARDQVGGLIDLYRKLPSSVREELSPRIKNIGGLLGAVL